MSLVIFAAKVYAAMFLIGTVVTVLCFVIIAGVYLHAWWKTR